MKSKNTRNRLLQTLSNAVGSVSASTLSTTLGVPTASVRRSIRELRAAGNNINTNYYGYRLQPSTLSSQQASA